MTTNIGFAHKLNNFIIAYRITVGFTCSAGVLKSKELDLPAKKKVIRIFHFAHDVHVFCLTGNYLKFYNAIREAYPDIQMISNCDGSSKPLDHPADLYDFHVSYFLQLGLSFPLLTFTLICNCYLIHEFLRILASFL